jgi:hypothetical protein
LPYERSDSRSSPFSFFTGIRLLSWFPLNPFFLLHGGIRHLTWFPLIPFFLLHGHQTPLLVPAQPLFPSSQASDASPGSRSIPFSFFTGIRHLTWFPLIPFFLLHGHQTPLLVPAHPLFPSSRASGTSPGSRSTPFSSFTGIRLLTWFPLNPFFLLHGHQAPHLVPDHPLFPSSRASGTSPGSRSSPFSFFTGIRHLTWFPLIPFFLLHRHQTPHLIPAQPLFPSSRASDASPGSRSTPFSCFTGIRHLSWFPLIPFFLLHRHQTPLLVPAHPRFPSLRASDASPGSRSPLISFFTGNRHHI